MDETIIKEGSTELNPEYFDVIRALTEKGITFVIASGRHPSGLKKALAPVLDCICLISQNGGIIDIGDQRLIPNPLPSEWAVQLWKELGSKNAAGSIIYSPDYCYIPYADTPLHDRLINEYKFDVQVTDGWDKLPKDLCCVMMTVYDPEDSPAYCKEHLDPIWQTRAQILAAGQSWVDIVPFASGKGVALQRLCEQLSIKPEEVVAFGDNMNDLSMIEFAGTGIAVENAKEPVKAAAAKIVPDYTKNGVLQELKEILARLS